MTSGKLTVEAMLQGDDQHPETGTVTFVDNSVDATTGTIKLKATFANRERRLWPGQFVSSLLTLSHESNAVVVPVQAVQTGQQGQYVYVVKPEQTVEARTVVITRTVDNDSIVQSGLASGRSLLTITSPFAGEDKGEDPWLEEAPSANTKVGAQFRSEHNITSSSSADHDCARHGRHSVFGIAHCLLPVSDLANVDFPTIRVSASLPGANPETMAAAVATRWSAVLRPSGSTTWPRRARSATSITIQFSASVT
jgi:hypothetical protein